MGGGTLSREKCLFAVKILIEASGVNCALAYCVDAAYRLCLHLSGSTDSVAPFSNRFSWKSFAFFITNNYAKKRESTE